jgi:hypothetical protein
MYVVLQEVVQPASPPQPCRHWLRGMHLGIAAHSDSSEQQWALVQEAHAGPLHASEPQSTATPEYPASGSLPALSAGPSRSVACASPGASAELQPARKDAKTSLTRQKGGAAGVMQISRLARRIPPSVTSERAPHVVLIGRLSATGCPTSSCPAS